MTELISAFWPERKLTAIGSTRRFTKKHRLKSGENKFELRVDKKPAKAGIDPHNILIDRNPSDNTKTLPEG